MSLFGNESARIDEQRHQAAVAADKLQALLLPDYPSSADITSIDDVHEAAIQIDLSKRLAAYYMDQVVWHQATAHDDLQGMERSDQDRAQEHFDRIKQIMRKVPDQPR